MTLHPRCSLQLLLSCYASVMPASCPYHVSVVSVRHQALSNPSPVNVLQLRFSGSFSVFPAVSAAFQQFLCLCMHVST
jgi:hypothetical protein